MNRILDIQDIDFEKIKRFHRDFYYTDIYDKLHSKEIKCKNPKLKDYYSYLKENLEDILISEPDKLELLKKTIENIKQEIPFSHRNKILKSLTKTKSKLDDKISKIFDYDRFVRSYLPSWGAYKFTQLLKINTCPYCNRQYVFTFDRADIAKQSGLKNVRLKDIKGKIRPELDHFYSQKDFPYFRLSVFNLVPSCHICNSNLKGRMEFDNEKFINPYHQSFHSILRFSVIPYKRKELEKKINDGIIDKEVKDFFGAELFNGNLDSFKIKLKVQKTNNITSENVKKALNNNEIFAIRELYNFHKDYVAEIIQKSIVYGESSIADIYDKHPNLFKIEKDVGRFLLGNYVDEDEIHKRPLSKLTIDVAKEFGIL